MVKYLTPIDLNKNELQNARVQNLAAAPDSPVSGQVYYNSSDNKLYVYDGTGWVDLTDTTEGSVTSVGATAPITSSGGLTPTIGVTIGTAETTVAAGDDSRFPTTDEKAALVGTGTPSVTNVYVTDDDTRLTDTRDPNAHTHNSDDVNAGTLGVDRIPALDAAKITTGIFDIARIPAVALERLSIVADETARFALTTASVQTGDTVKQTDTGVMYIVVDDTNLDSAAGYTEYSAGTAASVPWSGVTDKPSDYTPSSHTHGSVSNDGKIGTTANLPIITTTDGALSAGEFGSIANTFCQGDDSRLSDEREPARYSVDIGDGVATSFTVTHNKGTRDVMVIVRETASPYAQVFCDIEMATVDTITAKFASAPSSNQYRVTVI